MFPGAKRKLDEDLQSQEFEAMDAFMISKRRHTYSTGKLVNGYTEHVKHNKPPCAVEGCLSKGFAQLFSGRSYLQFDHENRVSYT